MLTQEQEQEEAPCYRNGSCAPLDDETSHKIEEAFNLWRHAWPIVKVLVPLSVTLFAAAYGVGFIQFPYAKQRQVDEMLNDQKRQDDAVKDLKSGIDKIHDVLGKLAERIGDLSGDVRETRAEMRSLYQPLPAAASAPITPAPQPVHAVRKKPAPPEQKGIFSR